MKKNMLRITSLLLALLMVFGTFAGAISVSDISDFPNDWSTEAMTFAVENGLLQGYEDNTIAPSKHMTRAEMATVINRAFRAWKQADIAFVDVSANAWYYAEVSKAVAFETFQGTSANMFTPNGKVTRAQAFTAIARALKLDAADASVLNAFQDAASIPTWANVEVAAMVAAGYVQGANGNLRPNAPLTRAEFAQVMYNIIRLYVSASVFEADEGNVIVVENGITIANKTIEGDLIVAANVSKLTINNVTIKGRLLVRSQYDLDLTVMNSTIAEGLVVYAPDQVTTVTTDSVFALKSNLKDYTTTVFKSKSTGGSSSGSGSLIPHAIRIHYPDTQYSFVLDVPYEANDNVFALIEKTLNEAYGVDGGLIEGAYNIGLAKANAKGFFIDSKIPTYEIEDTHEYTVGGIVTIDEKRTLGWGDIGGRPNNIDQLPQNEIEAHIEQEIENLRAGKLAEIKAELKNWSTGQKLALILEKIHADSLEKNFLAHIDIDSEFDLVVDSIEDSEITIDYTLNGYDLEITVEVEHTVDVNVIVDDYIKTHQPEEIIEACREGMKDMSANEKREWLLSKLPSRVYNAARKALNKLSDRDVNELFDIGVDMIPDESFTINHVSGTNRYDIEMVWECDPIVLTDEYYQHAYVENRILGKLAQFNLTPLTAAERALYDRLRPSNFVNDMGTYHTLLTVDEYYADAHEVLDLAEAAFRSRDYSVYKEKIDKAIEKLIPKALEKARNNGVTIEDDQGVAITDAQCIAAAKALYENPDISVDALIDVFGVEYIKISVSAKDRDTEIMISRIAR